MLEARLTAIARMVQPNARIADIGTDHAYLPIDLVKSKKISFAIASDVAKGPLDNANTDIKEAGLANKIETRLGSGLTTVKASDEIDTVIIAGMGGKLMTQLLSENKLPPFKNLILEPNVGEPLVRNWLVKHKYIIEDEEIIDTAGHIYEIIKAKLTNKKVVLTKKEIEFGPTLLKTKTTTFIKKWTNQLRYYQKLESNLLKAKKVNQEKLKQIKNLIEMIQEVLK